MRFARRLARAALILALACPASAFAVGHERIPLDHWSYLALERFESLGLCVLPDDRPFTRDEIAGLVRTIANSKNPESREFSSRTYTSWIASGLSLMTKQRAIAGPAGRYDRVWYGKIVPSRSRATLQSRRTCSN
jgi:hypothetical protein